MLTNAKMVGIAAIGWRHKRYEVDDWSSVDAPKPLICGLERLGRGVVGLRIARALWPTDAVQVQVAIRARGECQFLQAVNFKSPFGVHPTALEVRLAMADKRWRIRRVDVPFYLCVIEGAVQYERDDYRTVGGRS